MLGRNRASLRRPAVVTGATVAGAASGCTPKVEVNVGLLPVMAVESGWCGSGTGVMAFSRVYERGLWSGTLATSQACECLGSSRGKYGNGAVTVPESIKAARG